MQHCKKSFEKMTRSIFVISVIFCLCGLIPVSATPAVTPTCTTPDPGLIHSTYDTTGYNRWPLNRTQYDDLITDYATQDKLFDTGTIATINGSGNPFGSNEDYLTIFTGYIYAETAGNYIFAVDGDDAIEVFISGQLVTTFYGGHGRRGRGVNPNTIYLEAGYHDLTFHHQEDWGGDNYYLYWQRPGDTSLRIVEAAALSHCGRTTTVSLTKSSLTISDPVNLTVNPKAIPGAVVRFTLVASNTGSNTADNPIISDNLNEMITSQQKAAWIEDSITVTAPSIMGGAKANLTDAIDSDAGQFNDSAGDRVVSVNCGSLASGQTCTVTFDLEIN